jgi:hypothetical protein
MQALGCNYHTKDPSSFKLTLKTVNGVQTVELKWTSTLETSISPGCLDTATLIPDSTTIDAPSAKMEVSPIKGYHSKIKLDIPITTPNVHLVVFALTRNAFVDPFELNRTRHVNVHFNVFGSIDLEAPAHAESAQSILVLARINAYPN